MYFKLLLFFLKAKNWFIFLITWGVLLLLLITISVIDTFSPSLLSLDNREFTLNFTRCVSLLPLISIFSFLSWVWAILEGLSLYLFSENLSEITICKVLLVFMYIFLLLFFFVIVIPNSMSIMIYLLLPMLIIVIFGFFYCLYVLCNILREYSVKSDNTLSQFFHNAWNWFLLLQFFPFSIWIVQPIINRIGEKFQKKYQKFDK